MRKLFPPGLCYRVVLGLPIVLRCAPFAANPTLLLQPEQGGVYGALVQAQQIVTDLFKTSRDTITVERPYNLERFENHEVESALKDFGFRLFHLVSFAMRKGE